MVVTENGESESYGVEDGGLFVEMVVTSEIDIRKRKTQGINPQFKRNRRFLASF